MKIFQPRTKSVFLPKLGKDQKKKKSKQKVLHPNLVRFLAQNQVEAKKKGLRPPFLSSNPQPKLQRGGSCLNFAYYSMVIILSWRPKDPNKPWPNVPLNTPLVAILDIQQCKLHFYFSSFLISNDVIKLMTSL